MTTWTPTAGPRIAIGWRAMCARIDQDGADAPTWIQLLSAADRGSDLQTKTIKNLIREATRHGYLEKTAGGRYQLTEKGRNAR